jgi:hypothetical protein
VNEDPWAVYVPIITGLLRTVMAAMGGDWALSANSSQVQSVAGAIVVLLAAGWSAWHKIDAARKSHASSVESATQSAAATIQQGRPVAVVAPTQTAA